MAKNKIIYNDELFRLLIEYTPAAVAMLDTEMRYLFASKRWIEDYRLENVDIIGKTHYEVFPEIPEHWKEIHRKCLTGIAMSEVEDPFVRADGSVDWVTWEIQPWFKEDGSVGGIIMFTQVVTKEKNIEYSANEQEANFRSIFNNMSEGVALHDIVYDSAGTPIDYKIIDANPAYKTHTGIDPENARGKRATKLYGSETPPYFDIFLTCAITGEPNSFDTYYAPMKKHFKISVCSPSEGRFATVFEDITERVIANEELKRSRDELEAMIVDRDRELNEAINQLKETKFLTEIKNKLADMDARIQESMCDTISELDEIENKSSGNRDIIDTAERIKLRIEGCHKELKNIFELVRSCENLPSDS